jgi:hypothetical protein
MSSLIFLQMVLCISTAVIFFHTWYIFFVCVSEPGGLYPDDFLMSLSYTEPYIFCVCSEPGGLYPDDQRV